MNLLLDRIAERLERHSRIVLVLFSVAFLSVTGFLAATKLLWYDEIFTYYPARQETWSQVWSFFAEGLDVHTPIMALLVHASLMLFGDNNVALRLPAILGFLLLCLSIYAFVSYRSSKVYAMAAMLFPATTSALFYATEARPYGVILGVSAFALVCWQRASERNRTAWLIAMGAALSLCISLHYMAAFLWIPIGAAELVRTWQRRRIDWTLWIILIASLFPLAAFLPMIQTARANFISGIFAPPRLIKVFSPYGLIMQDAYIPLIGMIVTWLLISRSRSETVDGIRHLRAPAPLPERVLIATLALTPAYAVPLSFLGGIFVSRYVEYTVTGLAILLAMGAYRRARGDTQFAVVAVLCLGGFFMVTRPIAGLRQLAATPGLPFGAARPYENENWMRAIEQQPGLPVAVSPPVFFLKVRHYSSPDVQNRMFYLFSIPDALKYDGADSGDKNLKFLARRFPVQARPYEEFTAEHREFLLLAETELQTWLLEKLLAEGARLELQRRTQTYFLFHVTLPERDADVARVVGHTG
jgi:4-amino-4-deoxy-L-arabinose transferase-like glycosyltransferase